MHVEQWADGFGWMTRFCNDEQIVGSTMFYCQCEYGCKSWLMFRGKSFFSKAFEPISFHEIAILAEPGHARVKQSGVAWHELGRVEQQVFQVG